MTTNQLKNNNLYFYLYMATPLLLLVANYFTQSQKVIAAAFLIPALILAVLDQRELSKSDRDSDDGIVGSALGIIVFAPLYVYWRARDTGLKKWRWFFAYIVLALGCAFISTIIDDSKVLKTTACEVTTSIFKDQNSDVICLAVEGMKKVSDKHYRAKAVLSNGIDMPITIEERDNNYIYVTLAPLSGLLE